MCLNAGHDPTTPAPLRAAQSQDRLPCEVVEAFSASAAVPGEHEVPQRCRGMAGPEGTAESVPRLLRQIYLPRDKSLNPDICLMAREEEFVEIPAFLVSRKR